MTEIEAQLFQSFSDAMPYGVCLVDLHSEDRLLERGGGGDHRLPRAHEVLGRTYRGDLLIHCEATTPAPRCNVQ